MPSTPELQTLNTNQTLNDFILNNKENRLYLILAIAIILLQLVIYKYLFPYPNFFVGDSWEYLLDAKRNAQVGIYPIGYSMLLRFFSAFTISDTALIILQYTMLQAAALALNFTLFYFYSPARLIKILLLLSALFNPLFFPIANTISSDNFCLTLSLIWFSLLLWIIYKPAPKVILWHSFILYLTFTVRYNAMFFILISIAALYISKTDIKLKLAGLLIYLILIGAYVNHNRQVYYKISGIRQFTPFSGWQLANNALYTYRYIPDSLRLEVPDKFKNLDNTVREYFRKVKNDKNNEIEKRKAFHDYMWADESPLWIYFRNNFPGGEHSREVKYWAKAGPLYKEYGTWIITHYPYAFFKHVIIPHIQSWFLPPMIAMDRYNFGLDYIHKSAVEWFKYKHSQIKIRLVDVNIIDGLLGLYPLFTLLIHFLFWFLFIRFIIINKKGNFNPLINGLILVGLFWITNFAFNVFAGQIEMRYLLFPVHLITVFSLLLIGLI